MILEKSSQVSLHFVRQVIVTLMKIVRDLSYASFAMAMRKCRDAVAMDGLGGITADTQILHMRETMEMMSFH